MKYVFELQIKIILSLLAHRTPEEVRDTWWNPTEAANRVRALSIIWSYVEESLPGAGECSGIIEFGRLPQTGLGRAYMANAGYSDGSFV